MTLQDIRYCAIMKLAAPNEEMRTFAPPTRLDDRSPVAPISRARTVRALSRQEIISMLRSRNRLPVAGQVQIPDRSSMKVMSPPRETRSGAPATPIKKENTLGPVSKDSLKTFSKPRRIR